MRFLALVPSRAARRAVCALLLALPLATSAGAQPSDTTKISREPLFTKHDAWVAGGVVLGTLALFPVDRWAARELQDSTVQTNRFFRHQATNVRLVTESSLIIGGSMWAVGRLSKNEKMADLGLHGTEAIVVGHLIVDAAKIAFGRERPFVDVENPHSFAFGRGLKHEEARSFPSGHTVMAFAAASAVSTETARWWPNSRWLIGVPMYGGATLVGLSRMFNNKHWASDVMMGAAIGTFAGRKVVRYHHSHPGNKLDKWLLGARVMPTPDGGYAMSFMFR